MQHPQGWKEPTAMSIPMLRLVFKRPDRPAYETEIAEGEDLTMSFRDGSTLRLCWVGDTRDGIKQ